MSINCFRALWEPSITQLYSVLYFSWVVKSNQIFGVMGIDIMMLSATAPEFLMLLYKCISSMTLFAWLFVKPQTFMQQLLEYVFFNVGNL